MCSIGEEAFIVPEGYRQLNQWRGSLADQEEEMLQLAIRQSLLDQGVGPSGQEGEVSAPLSDPPTAPTFPSPSSPPQVTPPTEPSTFVIRERDLPRWVCG